VQRDGWDEMKKWRDKDVDDVVKLSERLLANHHTTHLLGRHLAIPARLLSRNIRYSIVCAYLLKHVVSWFTSFARYTIREKHDCGNDAAWTLLMLLGLTAKVLADDAKSTVGLEELPEIVRSELLDSKTRKETDKATKVKIEDFGDWADNLLY
jgi:hypothetical protein